MRTIFLFIAIATAAFGQAAEGLAVSTANVAYASILIAGDCDTAGATVIFLDGLIFVGSTSESSNVFWIDNSSSVNHIHHVANARMSTFEVQPGEVMISIGFVGLGASPWTIGDEILVGGGCTDCCGALIAEGFSSVPVIAPVNNESSPASSPDLDLEPALVVPQFSNPPINAAEMNQLTFELWFLAWIDGLFEDEENDDDGPPDLPPSVNVFFQDAEYSPTNSPSSPAPAGAGVAPGSNAGN